MNVKIGEAVVSSISFPQYPKITKTIVVMARNRRLVPVAPPATGFTSEDAGECSRTVEIEIDINALVRELALKALRSKSRRSREAAGAIVVKVVR